LVYLTDLPGNNQGILSQLNEEVASNLSRSVVLLVLTSGNHATILLASKYSLDIISYG
jgi:hypothetical protein